MEGKLELPENRYRTIELKEDDLTADRNMYDENIGGTAPISPLERHHLAQLGL